MYALHCGPHPNQVSEPGSRAAAACRLRTNATGARLRHLRAKLETRVKNGGGAVLLAESVCFTSSVTVCVPVVRRRVTGERRVSCGDAGCAVYRYRVRDTGGPASRYERNARRRRATPTTEVPNPHSPAAPAATGRGDRCARVL